MHEPTPLAPPVQPDTVPDAVPNETPRRERQPAPFEPDWPESRPEPQPKA